MANVVHKLSESEIKTYYNTLHFETSQLPPGMKARTKYNQAVINIYNSGKSCFKVKMRKLSHNSCFQDILLLLPNQQRLNNHLPKHWPIIILIVLVVTEAGSGDYFGPLTVCAAYVSKSIFKF